MDIYQLKIALRHIHPPIWRRLQVNGDIKLGELHDILQIAMDWSDSHLHAFLIDRTSYGVPDPDNPDGTRSERNIRLDSVVAEGDTFSYEYDFGDGWQHEIEVEKVLPAEQGQRYPVCLGGERAGPLEDCGGPFVYEQLLEKLRDPASPEYQELREWIGGDFDPEAFDLDAINTELVGGAISPIPPAPVYTDEELARRDAAALLGLMIGDEDRVPRNVIDECARRGDDMAELLSGLIRDDRNWNGEATSGEWWLLLHAVMILGLIPSERAGLLLVDFMRRMSRADDDNLQDWIAGYWPALFRNKPETVLPALHALSEDRGFDWYIRIFAVEAVVAAAQRNGETVLDRTLDWVAGMAADEREDWTMRLSACSTLLDLPRNRHRTLLDGLAARQSGLGTHFSANDVQRAYAEMKDKPGWDRFMNPWQFYDPAAIEGRRQRWEKESFAADNRARDDDDWDGMDDVPAPYIREIPKIGRNDPCPCGSGKKYKKCCLH